MPHPIIPTTILSATPNSTPIVITGDSIQDADLVGWVTVGIQHIPRAEDVPVISNIPTGFTLKPWNYFDGQPNAADIAEPATTGTCADPTADLLYQWAGANPTS